jgi:hypothetical protein
VEEQEARRDGAQSLTQTRWIAVLFDRSSGYGTRSVVGAVTMNSRKSLKSCLNGSNIHALHKRHVCQMMHIKLKCSEELVSSGVKTPSDRNIWTTRRQDEKDHSTDGPAVEVRQ